MDRNPQGQGRKVKDSRQLAMSLSCRVGSGDRWGGENLLGFGGAERAGKWGAESGGCLGWVMPLGGGRPGGREQRVLGGSGGCLWGRGEVRQKGSSGEFLGLG